MFFLEPGYLGLNFFPYLLAVSVPLIIFAAILHPSLKQPHHLSCLNIYVNTPVSGV
jgi:hypothetical protein